MVICNLTKQPLSYRDITDTSTEVSTIQSTTKNNCSSEEQQLKAILTNEVDPCHSGGDEFLNEITQDNAHRQSFTYPTETVSYERDHKSYLADGLNVGLSAIRVLCPWC